MELTNEIKLSIQNCILCWLATVDDSGAPNVSPKEAFTFFGTDELIIANLASPGSIRNILKNNQVCVSFIDIFVQKGYKIRGKAEVLQSGAMGYIERHEALARIVGERFTIASIIRVKVSETEAIVAPSYRFYPDTTEESQVESALRTYGVRRV